MSRNFSLINFSLFEFSRRVFLGGKISFKGLLMLPVYYLQIILALPFALLQFLIFRNRINNTRITKDPIFILGHYRCGTTYLQKLMGSNKQFGFLTNYDVLFPNSNLIFGSRVEYAFQLLINTFKIKNPFFHNTIVQLSEAGEEDDYLMNKGSAYSAYWGLIFPKRWRMWLNGSHQQLSSKYVNGWKREYLNTIKYVTFKNRGKQLVLKSPPNTERIKLLLQMFPHAKFVYIYRNPVHLYYSLKNMWTRAILKYYSVQQISDRELNDLIFGHFEYLTEHYERDKWLIPQGNLIELSYEELINNSFSTICKVYSQLNLPNFELQADDLLSQLEIEKGYRPFTHTLTADTIRMIKIRWGKYIHRWKYHFVIR